MLNHNQYFYNDGKAKFLSGIFSFFVFFVTSRDRAGMISLHKLLDTIEFQRRFGLAELNHDIMIARKKYTKHIEQATLLKRVRAFSK